MKKFISFAVTATAILGLGSFNSCQEEDFGASKAVLQERSFEHGFIKEFGKPSANQSWDFYAQEMQIRRQANLTRADGDEGDEEDLPWERDINQPTDDDFKELAHSWWYSLEEENDNSDVGDNYYNLKSTGTFKIYAVNYGGGIEVNTGENNDYSFDFGLVWLDKNNDEHEMPLFHEGHKQGYPGDTEYGWNFGNPGWGKEVYLPYGTRFYFYLRYNNRFLAWSERVQTGTDWWGNPTYTTVNHDEKRGWQYYQSNEPPVFIDYFGDEVTFENYVGPSTKLYTTERIDESTGKDEQIMMIGFEDAFGLDGSKGTNDYDDYDFNDVVLLIEGDLPVSENKRFFAEDKSALDWDYNDVVFDVSNTGIVLRAVGGTMPVWLKVTNKKTEVSYTEELHELLASVQHQEIHQNHKLWYEQEDENGEMQKYYKPIDVGANPGLWLDPETIIRWTIDDGTRLDISEDGEDEVAYFANPKAGNKKTGDVELIVGSYYGQPREEAETLAKLGSDENDTRPKISRFPEDGDIPAMFSTTTNVRWMKELKKITYGYKNFFGGGEVVDGVPQWWKSGFDDRYWYQFGGDTDPDDPKTTNP